VTDLSESAKICGSIRSRHSEEGDDMGLELLLPSVPIAESSVVLPPISPSSTNIIPAGLVEGFIEGRIDRGKVAERVELHAQVVLMHRGGVTEPGVLILKLLSIAYIAWTRHRAFKEAIQVYVL
jgi:hypothetical protein